MSVDVFAPTYDSAAAALLGANHSAASVYTNLTSFLNGSNDMAGNDSTSGDFAAAYDEPAQAAIDALVDLVDASGNLSVLTATSIENHRLGDSAAIYTAPPLLLDNCLIPAGAGEVDVEAYDVPASEGGDGGSLPAFLDVVIDHVQGVFWPSADVAKLRSTALGWGYAAGGLDGVAADCQTAIGHLNGQRSPEIPLAISAIRDLKTSATELADACASLATACVDYATEVETHREKIKQILKALAKEAALTIGAGVVLSTVTAGLSGVGATAAISARVGTYGARILTVLAKLKTAVRAGAVTKLGTVGTKVKKITPTLKRLARRTARSTRGGRKRFLPRDPRWGRPETLARHARDHGAQFGARNADEYAEMARRFYVDGVRRGLPTKVAPDGTVRMYDPASNTFISLDVNGGIKTMFKPTSSTYWKRQIGDEL